MAKKIQKIIDPEPQPPQPEPDYIFDVSDHEDEDGFPLFVFEIIRKPEEL